MGTKGRSIWLMLVFLGLAVGTDMSGPRPVLRRGHEWDEMQRVAKMPDEARRTIANAFWLFRYLEAFSLIEGRLPESYDELSSSVYFPSPRALINPYTGEVVRPVKVPSYGDLIWENGMRKEANGVVTKSVRFTFYYDPDGSRKTMRREWYWFSDHEIRDMAGLEEFRESKKIIDNGSAREKRLLPLCRNLDVALFYASENLLGEVPETIDPYLAIDWFFSPHRLPNLWTNQPMKAVSSRNPAPGDFSYGRLYSLPGEPTSPILLCYDEGGRVIWPWDWSRKMESEALRKSATGDTHDMWVIP
jgi:hypothetical protein